MRNVLKRRLLRALAIATTFSFAAALLHVGTNTNALGDDSFCDGSLSADDVREAFGGSGKFTDEPRDPFVCRIKRSNFGFGDDGARISLAIVSNSPRFPLAFDQWEVGGNVRMTSRGESIAVGEDGGWALLPASCKLGDVSEADRAKFRLLIKASSREGSTDPLGLARLLSTLRTSWTEQLQCASGDARPSSEVALQPASTREDADPARLCSLPGFSMAATDRDPAAAWQQTSGTFTSDWFCDVALKEPDPRLPEGDQYVRFAAVRNLDLVQGRKDLDPEVKCDGEPVHLVADYPGYPVDKAEGTEHGVVEASELYKRFVDAFADQEGCTRA